MKPTSAFRFAILASCLLANCAVGNAQSDSAIEKVGDKPQRQQSSGQLAQKQDKPAKTGSKSTTDKKQLPRVSNKRRAELIGFIKKHHPELRPLLNSLQKNRPIKFQAALQTLDREVKNLQALETRAPERYKISLDQWICRSNIKLLSAQLVLKKTDKDKAALKDQLNSLINRQYDLRIQLLKHDAAQTKKRLEKTEAQLESLRSNRGTDIQKQMATITRNAERILAAKKRAADAKKKQGKNQPGTSPNKKTKQQDDKI